MFFTGLKVEWYNHPAALLLSVNARMCGNFVLWSSSRRDILMVTMAAMNSKRFMLALCLSLTGIRNLQA